MLLNVGFKNPKFVPIVLSHSRTICYHISTIYTIREEINLTSLGAEPRGFEDGFAVQTFSLTKRFGGRVVVDDIA